MNNSQPQLWRRFRDHVFIWDKKFESRRRYAYRTEESSFEQRSGQTTIDAFLSAKTSWLDPTDHNYISLRAFLGRADDVDLIRDPPFDQDNRLLALIDERRDTTGWIDINGEHHSARDWDGYASYPPEGKLRSADILNACNLYRKLQSSRQATSAERRVLYIEDMTPLAGLALAASSSGHQAPILRDFLQRYISRRVYFGVAVAHGFSLEFHLPYYALRRSEKPRADSRDLRRYGAFNSSEISGKVPEFLYEAEISVLITGIDEWFWTAFCCVDNYYGGEKTIDFYHERDLDAPTGGSKPTHYPVWNPREYFLLALSQRFRQVTKEWGNVVNALEERLQYHEESVFNDAKQRAPLIDDPYLSRTRVYTWTIELLRLLHNALVNIIEAWENFERGELRYFEVGEDTPFHMLWNSYLAEIEKDLTELRFLRRALQQRIEMFEYMRSGLVNASAMWETRVSTLQGRNIALLTRVTVAYLPLSLGTAIFSMVMIPNKGSWIAYAFVLGFLLFTTLTIAFGSEVLAIRIRKLWAEFVALVTDPK